VQTENEKAVLGHMRDAFFAIHGEGKLDSTDEEFGLQCFKEGAAWQAALQSQSNTDGWVMVPVEPTQAMHDSWMYGKGPWSERYRAMLSAAPKAPQQVSNTPQDGKAETWTLDKSRRYVIRYNDDGEFGQVTGWLYSFADDFYADGSPAYVWKKLPVTVESISPVTGMTPTQQRIHDLECQAETDKAVIEQLLSTPPQQQEQSREATLVYALRAARPFVVLCDNCGDEGRKETLKLIDAAIGNDSSPATPTATASQESAPTSDQTGREPT
jgi:hypothetical protein